MDKTIVKATGKLRLRIYKNGELVEDSTSKNMVVNGGLDNICGLLAGDGTFSPIVEYQAGTNPTAPALTDTVITAAFTKTIAGYSYPATGSVNFNFTMELAENNGMNIQEYGLRNVTGDLCMRIVKSAVLKNNTIRIVGDWQIDYTN
jgi:hypothetical protein